MTIPVRSSSVALAFEQRAARAAELERTAPVAVSPLRFASGLLRAQAEVAAKLDAAHGSLPWTGRLERDIGCSLAELRLVPQFASEHAPNPLADDAASRSSESDELARTRLLLYWSGERATADDYLSRAMLRPYVEVLRANDIACDRSRRPGGCPFCGGAAVIACRRSASEADGAARSLVCALCGLEWTIRRIMCPACREAAPEKLPSFAADSHPTVRIEACETCRRYVKSIDVTHDERAVPEVDDLVSLSLDLWAGEQGFARIEPGLAGL